MHIYMTVYYVGYSVLCKEGPFREISVRRSTEENKLLPLVVFFSLKLKFNVPCPEIKHILFLGGIINLKIIQII